MPVLALLDQPGTMQCPSDLEAALLLLKKVKGKKKKKKRNSEISGKNKADQQKCKL